MAVVLGLGFTAIVAFRVATEATRMSAALTATQLALAREQKLSALGALAAATAHELGTPLGTIAVVAKELERELPPNGPHADDLRLLLTQVKRCRDILGQLAHHGEEGDGYSADVPLPALLEEIAAPYRDFGVEIEIRSEGAGTLAIPRRPEFMHGLTNLIENAADFARSRVVLTGGGVAPTSRSRSATTGPVSRRRSLTAWESLTLRRVPATMLCAKRISARLSPRKVTKAWDLVSSLPKTCSNGPKRKSRRATPSRAARS
jgi:two-component system sensor histidine kinase RegB